jgi:transcriptional regulator with XRE-family HTH domain
VHRRIGARVWEITHDRLDRELARFATELRMSNTRLSKLQQGLVEISVSDLLKIAVSVGRPVEELFLSREAYDDLQRGRRIRAEEGDRRRGRP